MKIPGFNFIIEELLQKYSLKNTTVVIDAKSFFYGSYKNSHLRLVFGTESDAFADYLKGRLMKYKEANVKCYFVFQGGDLKKTIDMNNARKMFETIFVQDIIKQVIDELGFEYVVCEYGSTTECIALAHKLSCPIISFNTEYCFSGVDYIPLDKSATIECGLFKLKKFLEHFHITEEILAIFIVIIDEELFPQHNLSNIFTNVTMLSKKIKSLLAILRKKNRDQILKEIFLHISTSDQKVFLDAEEKFKKFIQIKEVGGIPTSFITNNKNLDFTPKSDKLWFEKGVALKYIPTPYINIYHHKTVVNSNSYEDSREQPSLLLSMEIIKYAIDLLTNFKDVKIDLLYQTYIVPAKVEVKRHPREPKQCTGTVTAPEYSDSLLTIDYSIRKPNYNVHSSIFENGWNNIQENALFHHFVMETLQVFDFNALDKAPEDARLLMIALVYFSRKKPMDVDYEVFSILLSYVTLNLLREEKIKNKESVKLDVAEKPILDPIFDRKFIKQSDCEIALTIMKDFFHSSQVNSQTQKQNEKKKSNINYSFLHPLLEFQHCLQQLNYLNRLCGEPFKPTIYSKTYNGTLVYYTLEFIKSTKDLQIIKRKLNPAATVLAHLNGMMQIYEGLMY